MRNVRRGLLLALMALAAMATTAPTAFGLAENHETLEVTRESDGTHCSAVNPDQTMVSGCLIHAEGMTEIRKHVFGIESHIFNCHWEFWARLNEDAEGYLLHQKFTGANCPRQPCEEPDGAEPHKWPAHGDEAHNSVTKRGEGPLPIEGTEKLEMVFCIEPIGGGTDESCEIEIPFNEDPSEPGIHETEFGHEPGEIPGHGVSGFRCEIVGHWKTEHNVQNQWLENNPVKQAEDIVEITHIPAENKPEVP